MPGSVLNHIDVEPLICGSRIIAHDPKSSVYAKVKERLGCRGCTLGF